MNIFLDAKTPEDYIHVTSCWLTCKQLQLNVIWHEATAIQMYMQLKRKVQKYVNSVQKCGKPNQLHIANKHQTFSQGNNPAFCIKQMLEPTRMYITTKHVCYVCLMLIWKSYLANVNGQLQVIKWTLGKSPSTSVPFFVESPVVLQFYSDVFARHVMFDEFVGTSFRWMLLSWNWHVTPLCIHSRFLCGTHDPLR